MGNSSTSKHASNIQKHPKLGDINLKSSVGENDTNVQQMTIVRALQSENQFNKWYKELKKIDDSITRQVLLIPNKTVYESTGFCGSNGIVHLTYDYYPYIFQVQIQNRRRLSRFFLQTELWYLLYNMIRAGSKFQKYHLKIGDIHPSNILINDDGLIKLISTCSSPDQLSNFDKIIQNPKATVFLAPQQLQQHAIQRSEYPTNIDPSLAECYSIGLCMLAAGTLEDIDSIYINNQSSKQIQRHKVTYYLKAFGQRYSSNIYSFVMGLLKENPLQRKRCSEIYSSLYQYQDKILDLQTFFQSSHSFINPNILKHPDINQDKRQIYHQSRYVNPNNQKNVYYNPNGIVVNPIQSKYIPMNVINNQPVRQSMGSRVVDPNPIQYYRQSSNLPYNGQR